MTDFAGDQKEGKWLTARMEAHLKSWLVPRVPRCIETYHLTALRKTPFERGFLCKNTLRWK